MRLIAAQTAFLALHIEFFQNTHVPSLFTFKLVRLGSRTIVGTKLEGPILSGINEDDLRPSFVSNSSFHLN